MFVAGKPRTIFYPPDALITAFVAMVQKITTYALAAHDPGSAQDGRMSNNFCTPGMHLFLLTLTSMQRTADETIILMMVMLEMIMVMMGVMRIMVVMMGDRTMGDGTDTMQRAADGTSLLVTNQAFDFPQCSCLKSSESELVENS